MYNSAFSSYALLVFATVVMPVSTCVGSAPIEFEGYYEDIQSLDVLDSLGDYSLA